MVGIEETLNCLQTTAIKKIYKKKKKKRERERRFQFRTINQKTKMVIVRWTYI